MSPLINHSGASTPDPIRRRKSGFLSANFTLKTFLLLGVSAALNGPAFADFFIKDQDRVVFLGDSITEQRFYTAYIEAYTLTRYPGWSLTFRNAGWSGDTAGGGLGRLQRDVLSLKPTAVLIDYGMNDHGYKVFRQDLFEGYVRSETGLADKLKEAGARVALLTPQPIEELASVANRPAPDQDVRNQSLRKFGDGLKAVAREHGALFVDQFDPYMAILLKARAADPKAFIGAGDAVHPGWPGHALMAWAILKGVGATPLVSSVSIDAGKNQVVSTENCAVTNLKFSGGILSFNRLDRALPMPIDPRAEPALKLAPILDDLDRYELKIDGLKTDRYELFIDGETAGTATSAALAKGWNIALVKGPLNKQVQELLQLIFKKNDAYCNRWRNVQLNPQRQAELPKLDEEIAHLETQINAARVPKPHHFELKPIVTP